MAHVKGKAHLAEMTCTGCHQVIEFTSSDLRHYRHDVDGNNVFIRCPDCQRELPCSQLAIARGWVPSGD